MEPLTTVSTAWPPPLAGVWFNRSVKRMESAAKLPKLAETNRARVMVLKGFMVSDWPRRKTTDDKPRPYQQAARRVKRSLVHLDLYRNCDLKQHFDSNLPP